MKQIILFLVAFCIGFASNAQTGTFDKVNVRSSIKLSDKTITEISTDTTLADQSDAKLSTQRAIKSYIDNMAPIIRRAGGGITKNGDSIYLGGDITNLFLNAVQDGINTEITASPGDFSIFNLDGFSGGSGRFEINSEGELNLSIAGPTGNIVYDFGEDSLFIQNSNFSLHFPHPFAFYRDGRFRLNEFRNTAPLNFLSTDSSGFLKSSPLKTGNGIIPNGDSLSLGGNFSQIDLEHDSGSSSIQAGDGFVVTSGVDRSNNWQSYFSMGGGNLTMMTRTDSGQVQFSLNANELKYDDGRAEKFTVNNNGVNIGGLNVLRGLTLNVFHLPLIVGSDSTTDMFYSNCVIILDNILSDKTLTLPDPSSSIGRVYYIFNANTLSASYHLSRAIFTTGNTAYFTITGNTTYHAMIVSDGAKWLQLN